MARKTPPVETVDLPEPETAQPIEAEELNLGDQWVFMIDPGWQPTEPEDEPAAEAVVGGWFVDADGNTGRFKANPAYEPSEPDFPTDPVDAALQLVVHGGDAGAENSGADPEAVLRSLGEVMLTVALNEEGAAIVAPAPDDVPCVLVATAPAHHFRVDAPEWLEATIEDVVAALPEEGVDVLLNPGSPASMRVLAVALRRVLAESDAARETESETEPSAGSSAASGVASAV